MNNPPKIFFLSDSGNSSLSEFINTNLYYESFDVSFKKLKIENLLHENPDIIVIDLYFSKKPSDELISEVLKTFGDKPIYFLSPVNNDFKSLKERINTQLHFLSNFSTDVIQRINHYLNTIALTQFVKVG